MSSLTDGLLCDRHEHEPIIVVHEAVWFVHVVHVFDEVDCSNAAALAHEIETADVEGESIVVELTNCRYIDSSALGVLVRAFKHYGSRFAVVVKPGSAVERILKITELDRFLPIVASVNSLISDTG